MESSVMRRALLSLALAAVSCSQGSAAAPADASVQATCGAGFTACVRACGEKDDREATAATCADGVYTCPAPLTPAITCGPSAWPTGPFAGCGPWVEGYDCTSPAVCESGLWTCAGAASDAGTDATPN